MHKSVIILSILFLGFDLSAGRHVQYSEARRLAALGIDYEGFSFAKKKRESSGTSPVTIVASLSHTTSPIAIVRSLSKAKEEDRSFMPKAAAIPVCDSPCGFWIGTSSSFPGDGNFLLSLASSKKISPLAPYSDCP